MNLFIIGNGESRKNFDLNVLRNKGCIIGCNAIYRDFKPDILISVDRSMIKEIRDNCKFLKDILFVWRKRYKNSATQNDLQREFYFDSGEGLYQRKDILSEDKGWSAGVTAVLVCLRDIFSIEYGVLVDNVYLIGFDLSRLKNGKGSSMYKDTDNYIKSNSPGATHGTSVKQLKLCFNMFNNITFKRVIDKNHFLKEWKDIDNIKNITYQQFKKEILKT